MTVPNFSDILGARREHIAMAGVAVLSLVATIGALNVDRMTGAGGTIWLASALLVALGTSLPTVRSSLFLAAGGVGIFAGHLATGGALVASIGWTFVELVQVALCLLGMRAFASSDFTRLRDLSAFVLLAFGPATILPALLVYLGNAGGGAELSALGWYASRAVGMVAFTPLISVFLQRSSWSFDLERSALAAIIFIATVSATFLQSRYPFLFLVSPALILITLRTGYLGAALCSAGTAVLSLVATAGGYGPLALIKGSPSEQLLVAQFFNAFTITTTLIVAAMQADRQRLSDQSRSASAAAQRSATLAHDANERYRLLAQQMTDVVMLRLLDGTLEYVSPSITSLTGFTPAEYANTPIAELFHPDDAENAVQTFLSVGPDNKSSSSIQRRKTKGGEWIWVETLYTYIPAEGGNDAKVMGVLRDATQRRIHEAQLKAARDEAEAALLAKSEFLAVMSHELRTPLNSIIGFSNLIAESGEIRSEEGTRHVRNISNSSSTLLSIVNDIMDVSKFEARAIDLDPQPFCLAELFDTATAMVSAEADAKGLPITTTIDPRIPQLLVGDDARLRQILLNLLSNALKFTAQGSIALSAECLENRDHTSRFRISVSDTGIGIPADKLERLFKPFSQVDQSTSRRYGGTGLGLTICKRLVELMGGTISVHSNDGEGSTVSIDLDLPISQTSKVDVASRHHGTTNGTTGSLSILIAEDVPLNQDLLVAMLERWGHKADVASDGVIALDAVARHHYDVVLMDIQMPGIDGIEATRRIRAMPGSAAQVPIVALTANVLPTEVARIRASGIDDFVGKPFVPEALQAAISRAISSRQPRARRA